MAVSGTTTVTGVTGLAPSAGCGVAGCGVAAFTGVAGFSSTTGAGVLGFEATAGSGVAGLSSSMRAGVRGLLGAGEAATGVAGLEDLADAADLVLFADFGGPALDLVSPWERS